MIVLQPPLFFALAPERWVPSVKYTHSSSGRRTCFAVGTSTLLFPVGYDEVKVPVGKADGRHRRVIDCVFLRDARDIGIAVNTTFMVSRS